ncbi:outer membrane protein assembly factor BamB family protein [Phaeocystidibacter luteus]|uniref:PQQ-binding-like beta-propeller repeat protein n=1 Tax=Phaeocystidibacter luteus TaxID=911197 RepID=A0A6N6RL92_9FLAO|nr:PQQ-binding-like beta-propeller repeat protein [Phaeocystidibacter luteus]KAB2814051.1 PQQ-binding-like beta-propeller repeat protein [Phaeocystidibacter luteus]
MKKLVLILFCVSQIIACDRPEVATPEPNNELEILWSTRIVPDGPGFNSLSMSPVLFEDHLIVNSEYNFRGLTAPVIWLDTATGEIDTMWSDYVYHWDYYTEEDRAVIGDYLFLGGLFAVDCIDMRDASTQWGSMFDDGYAVLYTHDGYLYRTMNYTNPNGKYCAVILRTPAASADWDTVYTYCSTTRLHPSFVAFDFGELSSGDEVLVAKRRSEYLSSNANGETTIFAYNLTADSLQWESERLETFCGFVPLQVHGPQVYGMIDSNFVALSMEDGSVKWKTPLPDWMGFPSDLRHGDFHVSSGKIVLKGTSPYFACLDAEDGTLLWTTEDGYYHNLNSRFVVYQNRIYCSNAGLAIVDLETGQRIVDKEVCDKLGYIQGDIVLDPERGVMYMQNGKDALCVRIPK